MANNLRLSFAMLTVILEASRHVVVAKRVLMPWFGDVWAFRRRLQSLGLAEASKLTMVSRTTMAAKNKPSRS